MKVSDVVDRIKKRINDLTGTGYPAALVIDYLNDAINYVSARMVTVSHPLLLKKITITDGSTVPDNFLRFAGTYPVRQIGTTFVIQDGSTSADIMYFSNLQNVSLADDMPISNPGYVSLIIQIACIYALNKNEFDTGQDGNLAQELAKACDSAFGGGAA